MIYSNDNIGDLGLEKITRLLQGTKYSKMKYIHTGKTKKQPETKTKVVNK